MLQQRIVVRIRDIDTHTRVAISGAVRPCPSRNDLRIAVDHAAPALERAAVGGNHARRKRRQYKRADDRDPSEKHPVSSLRARARRSAADAMREASSWRRTTPRRVRRNRDCPRRPAMLKIVARIRN
ncbi:hypothetical protein [Burkholderia sp. BE17]|uniref:hypothetical protein n=1 Tax=Burkholderia sp. BE17 TaxID=2656644 RepID=UPI00128E7F08|nr:hypothetical protein [Burkholderia sp. BE17]MPV65041.1 hypothetical protein [Burkholderia sp. BE17]